MTIRLSSIDRRDFAEKFNGADLQEVIDWLYYRCQLEIQIEGRLISAIDPIEAFIGDVSILADRFDPDEMFDEGYLVEFVCRRYDLTRKEEE